MRKHCLLISVLLSYSISLYCQSPNPIKYQSLEPYDFHLQYLKHDSALLIDVRESFEFRGKRIRDAINIPSSSNLEFATNSIDKNFSLFFYCTTDYRSRRVAEFFYDKGFRKVYNLEGGIVAWRKDGFPVVKGKKVLTR
jgi:rhodanese-related sulfurtransferase